MTEIGASTFSGTSLQNVTLPPRITDINSSTFSGCTSLQSIIIPESVKIMRGWAFEGCKSLAEVSILNPRIKFSDVDFKGCTGILRVNLPDRLTWDKVKSNFVDSPCIQNNIAK